MRIYQQAKFNKADVADTPSRIQRDNITNAITLTFSAIFKLACRYAPFNANFKVTTIAGDGGVSRQNHFLIRFESYADIGAIGVCFVNGDR